MKDNIDQNLLSRRHDQGFHGAAAILVTFEKAVKIGLHIAVRLQDRLGLIRTLAIDVLHEFAARLGAGVCQDDLELVLRDAQTRQRCVTTIVQRRPGLLRDERHEQLNVEIT